MRGNHFPFLFTAGAGVFFKRGSFLLMFNMKKNNPWVFFLFRKIKLFYSRGGGFIILRRIQWPSVIFLQGSLLFFTPQRPKKLRLSNLRFEKNFSKNILCQIKYSTVLYNSLSNTNSVPLKKKFYIHDNISIYEIVCSSQRKNDIARLFVYMWICL